MLLGYVILIGGIVFMIFSFSNKLIDQLFKDNHSLGLHIFRIAGIVLLLNGANMTFLHL